MQNIAFFYWYYQTMEKIRLGIIGAGHIATKMVAALAPLGDAEVLAVASRSFDKAREFAAANSVERAYGSYEELVRDPDVDLVYVATPHSHHLRHARLAIENGKPALVEKAFTANALRAEWGVRYPMD